MKKQIIMFPIIFLSLIGCIPEPKILEDIQLVQSVGYDLKEKDEYIGTAGSSFVPPGENASPTDVTLTAEGKTVKQMRQRMQALSAKPIEIGRLGIVIFSQEVAEAGIQPFIDNYERDPNIGRDIHLVVSKDKASDIIQTNYVESEDVSQYIIDVIHQNIERTLPRMNLHHYLFQYYAEGYDPFMPMISKSGNQLEVIGVALFNGDKYIDTIPFDESYIFKILYEKASKGQFEMDYEEDESISVQNIVSNTKYKIERKRGEYKAHFTINFNGKVSESGGLDLTDKKNIKKVEKALEKEISARALTLIDKFKTLEVDPLGLGDKARQKGIYNKEEWEKQYPNLPVTIETKIHVVQSGIAE
ncbi:hypothetical protein AB685_00725 [Bacillus sp. LL01]|uniref:Ger(x)C family spore germination protein n=1 Tax=Bacillus sp. LL01 TaxID=1665556 RepID=UPI00064CFFE8|nr:Ger(x)C family spore germination protein [Bacillus sp. LL01]KMJ59442.1 hypothetical protein AB685_00725 [Bacillus sp. LL01]